MQSLSVVFVRVTRPLRIVPKFMAIGWPGSAGSAGRNASARPLVAGVVRVVEGRIVVARIPHAAGGDALFEFLEVELEGIHGTPL